MGDASSGFVIILVYLYIELHVCIADNNLVNLSNLPKTATMKFTVLTNNHGVGANTDHKWALGLTVSRIIQVHY